MAAKNVIYGLHNGDGVIRYVGLSSSSTDRLYRHRYDAKRGVKSPVYNWVRKYGTKSLSMTILEEVPGTDLTLLDEREIFWIAKLREEGADLLNLSAGGRLMPGYQHSVETRAKMVANANGPRGATHPMFGTTHSPELRAKMSAGRIGLCAGESHHNSKLTESSVAEIRARLAAKETCVSIAKDFGVTYQTIYYIKIGATWKETA